MSKEELKLQYKLHRITAKEYFLALGRLIAAEVPATTVRESPKLDPNLIFDGNLPIFQ